MYYNSRINDHTIRLCDVTLDSWITLNKYTQFNVQTKSHMHARTHANIINQLLNVHN